MTDSCVVKSLNLWIDINQDNWWRGDWPLSIRQRSPTNTSTKGSFGFYVVNSTISWVSGCLEHSIPMGSWVCITNRNMGKYEFVSPIIVWEGMINAVAMIFFRSSPRCPRPCCRPPCPRQPSPRPPTRQSSLHPTTLRSQGTRLKRFHHWNIREDSLIIGFRLRASKVKVLKTSLQNTEAQQGDFPSQMDHFNLCLKVMARLNCSRVMTLEMVSVARQLLFIL